MSTASLLLVSLFAAGDLQFAATTVGTPASGPLTALESGWTIRLGDMTIPAGSLVELRQSGRDRPMPPFAKPHLLLANGDRWAGQILDIKDDRLRFAPAFGATKEVSLPLTAVVAGWLGADRGGVEPDPLDFDLAKKKRATDVVRLANGDLQRGTLVAADGNNFKLENAVLPRSRVASFALASDLVRPLKAKGALARLVLADGSRLTLVDAALADGRVTGTTQVGPTVRVLVGDIVAVNIAGGPAVYLSELTPTAYEHTPYLGATWPLGLDRTANGGPLRIAGDTFDRGLGMHSRSGVKFAVPAGATRFESHLGLDALAASGHAIVRISFDGKETLGATELSGAESSRLVSQTVPVGARELMLHVDFGRGGDVQDRVNWGDARFVLPSKRLP